MARINKRILLLSSALLFLPFAVQAQDDFLSFEQPNELMARTDRAQPGTNPGSSPADLAKYAKIVRAVDLAISFQTKKNDTGHNLAGLELSSGSRLDAKVRFKKKNGEVFLDSLNLVPTGTMKFADKKINKVTFNRKGELHIDIKGMPDLWITNIEKKRNGDTHLHLRGLPDITIKKDGRVKMLFFKLGNVNADFNMPDWPPTLEDLLKMATKKDGSDSKTDLATIVSSVKWDGNAVLDADKMEVSGEVAKFPKGTYDLALTGAAKNVNGRLESMGENKASMNVHFIPGGRVSLGPVDADVAKSSSTINGRYRFSVPLNDSDDKRLNFEWDGRADFDFKGKNVDLYLPSNTHVYAGNVEVDGAVDHRFVFNDGVSTFEMRKGNYKANFNGPMKLEGVTYDSFKLDPLNLSGSIDMSGDVTTRNGLIVHRGEGTVRTKVESTGIANAIANGDFESKVTILKGSKFSADIKRFTTFTPLSMSRNNSYGAGTNAEGNIDLGLLLGESKIKTGTVDLELPHGPHNLNIKSDLNIRNRGDRIDVRRGTVHVSGTAGAAGKLKLKNAKTYRKEGTVTTTQLNARSGPSKENARLNSFAKGAKLNILKSVDDATGKTWHLVEGTSITGRKIKGYVSGKYVDVKNIPSDGLEFAGTIKKGTHIEFNLDSIDQEQDVFANFAEVIRRANGGLKAHLKLGRSDLSLGALKASIKNGEATLSASANDGLSGTIRLGDTSVRTPGTTADLNGTTDLKLEGGARTEGDARKPVKMEFQIALRAGSKITMTKPGSNTKVTIKGDESHLRFEALATIGADGKPAVQELKNVDLKLELGEAAASFLGRSVTAPGEKVITLKHGRIVFLDNGIDIYGDFAVHVRSVGNTPAVSIRW
jgi:hypothetical protein